MNYLFLTKTAFFNGLSENEIKTILNCFGAYQKSFKKSEIIYYSGDTVSDMGLVLSGSVNIVVNYYWGSSNIFNHIGEGEIFAETYATIPNKEMLCDVVAAEKTEVLFINVEKVLSVCENQCSFHNRLLRNLLKNSAQKNISLATRMMHTASKFIRDRLLSYFSEQAILNGGNTFTVPFSRQQLADYLGVDRSAMSNELSKMKHDGLIDYQKNDFILINNDF